MPVRMDIPMLRDSLDPDQSGPFAPPPTYVKPHPGMVWAKDWEMSDEFDRVAGFWIRWNRWLL